MTDSETLRAMLKERGIKYKTRDALGACETSWCGYTAYQLTPESKLIMNPTPEQAIAATVGAGTCTIVKTWTDSDYADHWRYSCSECGYQIEVGERDIATGNPTSHANFCWNCGRRIIEEETE